MERLGLFAFFGLVLSYGGFPFPGVFSSAGGSVVGRFIGQDGRPMRRQMGAISIPSMIGRFVGQGGWPLPESQVGSSQRPYPAQPAAVADRFAAKIGGILRRFSSARGG